jgi:tetratricopeptide (TPR) repeat protein
MDRRALRNCGAVLVSLGAVLSAGCGAKSVSPSTSSSTASLAVKSELEQQAVVVTRSEAPTAAEVPLEQRSADHELAKDGAGTPLELVAIEPQPTESSTAAAMADKKIDTAPAVEIDGQYALDDSTSPGQADAAPTAAPQEPDPVATPMDIAAGTDSEIRFALPSTGGPEGADELADGEALQEGSQVRIAKQAVRADHGKRALTPVMVMPREIPRAETALDPGPPAVASPLVARQPVTVAPAPALDPGPPAVESTLVTRQPVTVAPTPALDPGPPAVESTLVTRQPVTVAPTPALDPGPPTVESPLVTRQPVTVAPTPALDPGPPAVESPLVAKEPAAAPPPTPLPPVRVVRSPALTAAIARVQERVRHGIQLAEKGALYASRKEFTTAVKMVAQAQDVEQVTRRHTQAAINGFVALKEANDFVRQNAELRNLDVARLVAGHKTTVLKDEDVTDMPPTVAAGYYYEYAKNQLADAVGRETTGSIALYGLGKIIVAGAGPNSQQLEYTGPAMALFQAALISEPRNFRAAHELGVLLAGSGQLEQAREMLMESVAMSPQPVIWRNLATVHARMGERQLAEQAQQNANALRQANPESKAPPVEWVDPATFASTVSATDTLTPPVAPPPAAAIPANSAQNPTNPKANVAKKRSERWNPLNLRR